MKYVWILILLVFGIADMMAQSGRVIQELSENFESYRLEELSFTSNFKISKQSGYDVVLSIPSPDGKGLIRLELFKSEVFSDDYVLTTYDGNQPVTRSGSAYELGV